MTAKTKRAPGGDRRSQTDCVCGDAHSVNQIANNSKGAAADAALRALPEELTGSRREAALRDIYARIKLGLPLRQGAAFLDMTEAR